MSNPQDLELSGEFVFTRKLSSYVTKRQEWRRTSRADLAEAYLQSVAVYETELPDSYVTSMLVFSTRLDERDGKRLSYQLNSLDNRVNLKIFDDEFRVQELPPDA